MAPIGLQLVILSLVVLSSITRLDAALIKRDPSIPAAFVGKWSYQGCYTDDLDSRSLDGPAYVDEILMTDEACMSYCGSRGYNYAGTEWSEQCFCGKSLSDASSKAPDSDCSMICTGNATEPCGGDNRLSLFYTPDAGAGVNPGFGKWTSLGCYNDTDSSRTLPIGPQAVLGGSANASVLNCLNQCQSQNYKYAGLEAGSDCWCANKFTNGSGPALDGAIQCNATCNGNSSEYCGGIDRLNVYGYNLPKATAYTTVSDIPLHVSSTSSSSSSSSSASSSSDPASTSASSTSDPVAAKEDLAITSSSSSASSSAAATSSSASSTSSAAAKKVNALIAAAPAANTWNSLGCYTDNVVTRTFVNNIGIAAGPAGMTVEACQAAGLAAGYVYCGVEWSQECWCDNSVENGGGPAPDGNTGCNMACNGDATETCGGSNRLNAYYYGIPPTGSSTSSTASSTASSTSTAALAGASGWNFLGCWTDDVVDRTFANNVGVPAGPAGMTVEDCQTAGKAAGYKYCGLEYSQECWCDNTVNNGGGPAPDGTTGCNMLCNGNQAETCGGSNRLDVYSYGALTGSSTAAPTSSTTSSSSSSSSTSVQVTTTSTTSSSTSSSATAQSTGWNFLGCYTDDVAERTLANNVGIAGGPAAMTRELCQAAGQAAGYLYCGVEYGKECWCDNTLNNGGGPAPDGDAQCNMNCNGDATEVCGGPDRLDLFHFGPLSGATSTSSSSFTSSTSSSSSSSSTISSTSTTSSTSSTSSSSASSTASLTPGWHALGCYTDDVVDRTLANGEPVTGGAAAMSIEACTAECQSLGFVLAGVEYSAECYCDNEFRNGGGPAPDGDAQCTMTCNGNTAEICGGPNRLNVFTYVAGPPASTTSTSTSATSKPTSSTTTPSQPSGTGSGTATNLPAGWTYDGCYVDNANGRILAEGNPDNNAVTIESCIATCIAGGYTVAGLEYSVQCFCDKFIRNGGTLAAETDCAMPCGGAAGEICGGPNRMNIFSTGPLTVYQPPTPQTTGLPGSFVYAGCYTDLVANGNVGNRTLQYEIEYDTTNDATTCLTQCMTYGYAAAGLEYSSQCYCGDPSGIDAALATKRPDSECTMFCSGDPNYICGDNNRLTLYLWQGGLIDNFEIATGNAAGEYQYLVTAPVVALITTFGTNRAVTFVEKSGTSETPGSTGAYELDLDLLTFRTMHVKTDVFCSGSLVLPDKVGRQLNVGGWSYPSTTGLRLYWPNGSPGVPGTNDWQENWQEVSLQAGRWYPGSVVLANGSILVVGGEEGSNGAPVPTLEILPTVGPQLFMQWLNDTDPYNLYPFLCVLYSGHVFVAYYNQARILDQVTFDTITEFPLMPTAVNNPAGGRTYPLEGTMVILPQHAPYTDPLTVLIAGGSTPFGGWALDNLVTLQPEVAGAEWVLERMPSTRVMSCMTALPDGTYLIINGAHHGEAGFGLGSDPNYNCLLYDPTKPLHNRITILANTTIARLYHSEAILLGDGRVLVSGSDPETPGLIQEYRVEVFIPPYLMGNPVQPSLVSVPNTDWAYGGTYTVTISNPSGGAIKFTLMGAESSTHGNSFGQRTMFPAFSCTGNTCTITAPPNANVSPPAWHQLFVLSGGTPGTESVFVRIGGDPAELGNWPDFPDFDLPGI